MKISILYYSGAGNTKFITKKLVKRLKAKSHEVILTKINNRSILDFEQDADMFIIGFPVYDLTSPELIRDAVENISPSGKPIAYFCTKAFMSADSILELMEISEAKGLKTVAAQDFYMPGTDALALFAKKDSRTEKVVKFFHSRNIGKKLDKFVVRMEKGREIKISKKWYSHLSFLIPKSVKKTFHDQYSKYVPQFHSIKDLCIECMVCVKGCPRENIYFDDGIQFNMDCDMCLHCLHHCPVDSIQLGEMTKGNVRYKKVEIKV